MLHGFFFRLSIFRMASNRWLRYLLCASYYSVSAHSFSDVYDNLVFLSCCYSPALWEHIAFFKMPIFTIVPLTYSVILHSIFYLQARTWNMHDDNRRGETSVYYSISCPKSTSYLNMNIWWGALLYIVYFFQVENVLRFWNTCTIYTHTHAEILQFRHFKKQKNNNKKNQLAQQKRICPIVMLNLNPKNTTAICGQEIRGHAV